MSVGKVLMIIEQAEKELEAINEKKLNARSIDASRVILLEHEKQQSYIKGLKEALEIIKKK